MKKIIKTLMLLSLASLFFIANPNITKADGTGNYYIKVNTGTCVTTVYKKNGSPYRAMICSPGEPTASGTYYTPEKYRWKLLLGPSYGQYSTRIYGGVLFHSVYYWTNGDKSSMDTSAYNLLGTLQSHGCVRLLVKDAKWIYENCPLGTKVVIFRGTSKDDPLGRPSYQRITNGQYTNWDPTDPDPNNPWIKYNAKPTISYRGDNTHQYKSSFDFKKYIIVKSSTGKNITSKAKVSGKINPNKIGNQYLTITIKDNGQTVSRRIRIKVRDNSAPTIYNIKGMKVGRSTRTSLSKHLTAKTLTGKNVTSSIKTYVFIKGKYVYAKYGCYTFTKDGRYKVKYTATGTNGKVKTRYAYAYVSSQKIVLYANSQTITQGSYFNPYKYISGKYRGKLISKSKCIKVSGKVNTNVPGKYKITFTAQYGSLTYTRANKSIYVYVKAKPVEKPTEEPTEQPVEQPAA